MSYGILLVRLVMGLTLVGHGSQKLFGVFGGLGQSGEREFLTEFGFRAPVVMAFVLGFGEAVAGLMFASGFVIPVASLAIAVFMINAIFAVLRPHGYFVINGGYEYAVLIWTVAVGVAATGGGRFSIDAAIGWADNISGLWWGVGVAGASVAISAVTLTVGRRPVSARAAETGSGAPVGSE